MPRLTLRVKPGCKQSSRLEQQSDGSYVAFLHARAHGGEANQELVKMLAKEFGVAKTSITIVSGAHSRDKVIEY